MGITQFYLGAVLTVVLRANRPAFLSLNCYL